MLSLFNISRKKEFFSHLLFFTILFSIYEKCISNKQESLRLNFLLDSIPRYIGRAYSNKINIQYVDNGKFTCNVNQKIYQKEFSFLSTSSYSICSDKLFENFDLLAKRISLEVESNLDQKLISNVNFLNDFKQVLYFAYNLAYLNNEQNLNVTDNFFDKKKLTDSQNDIFNNFPQFNFNIMEFSIEDLKIINNYLHTIIDFNINLIIQRINTIIENIENTFKGNKNYDGWLSGNSDQIKYFIGIIWENAIDLDFEYYTFLIFLLSPINFIFLKQIVYIQKIQIFNRAKNYILLISQNSN